MFWIILYLIRLVLILMYFYIDLFIFQLQV